MEVFIQYTESSSNFQQQEWAEISTSGTKMWSERHTFLRYEKCRIFSFILDRPHIYNYKYKNLISRN